MIVIALILRNFFYSHTFWIIFLIFNSFTFSQNIITSKVNSLTSRSGLEIGFGYVGDYFTNFDNKYSILHNFDLTATLDLNKSFSWKNATLHSHLLGNLGDVPNEFIGSIQGISNIAAPNTWKIYEFWVDQKLLNDRLSILFGLYDLNSEFDNRESSSIFINPSHGIGPDFSLTGKNGPSIFPTTSLSLRLLYKFSKNISAKIAVLDAVPGNLKSVKGTHVILEKNDGVLFAAEVDYEPDNIQEFNSYKFTLGGWLYSNKFNSFRVNDLKFRNYGLYGFAEKKIYSENDREQGIIGFVRLGIAESDVNRVRHYFGAGVNYLGLIPGRDNDIFGVGLSACSNSKYYLETFNYETKSKKNEVILEITYLIDLYANLSIQPDFQYIFNPTFSEKNNTAVFGLRIISSL